MPNRRAMRARSAAVAATVALFTLVACESEPTAASGVGADGGPVVVAPGRPGEPARTISPEEAARSVADDSPNSADFRYAQMMITHHAQALTMTALAPDRAASPQVKKVAARIAAAQQPEIGAMRGWLKAHGGPRPSTGHDHHTMPGMATEAQLTQLRAARGTAFDELFLKLMTTHHQGAVTMAAEALSEGNNVQIEEMANDVIAQQTAEINRMRSL